MNVTDIEPFRVLVSGWRNWPQAMAGTIRIHLDSALTGTLRPMLLIHGLCPTGVDSYADQWGSEIEARRPDVVTVERWPANWNLYGRGAGPRRNIAMLSRDPAPEILLAFPGPQGQSPGTWHCIREAKKRGIPTRIFPAGQWT